MKSGHPDVTKLNHSWPKGGPIKQVDMLDDFYFVQGCW